MTKHVLFPADELEPGEVRRAEVGGVGVAVVRLPDGSFRAMRDLCAHEGARLTEGWLIPRMVADDVDSPEAEGVVLRCPWHGYEFDLDSGRCIADPGRVRARPYPVTVEDGRVVVERTT
jgi:3-phenylpropionate/trans-cinnamate dioxygenase ferredoxin subunit